MFKATHVGLLDLLIADKRTLQTITRALLLLMMHIWLFEMFFGRENRRSFFRHYHSCKRPLYNTSVIASFIISSTIPQLTLNRSSSPKILTSLEIQEPKKSSLTRTLRICYTLVPYANDCRTHHPHHQGPQYHNHRGYESWLGRSRRSPPHLV